MSFPTRSICALLSLALFFLAFDCRSAPAVSITEFMADNASGLADEDGDFSDWIEIGNSESSSVDLAGWRLTDDAGNLSKWRFPAGSVIPAGERLIVFASGKNRTKAGAPLHTNFNLKKEGEYLALLPPADLTPATEFRPAYPPQRADVSFGTGVRLLSTPLVGEHTESRIQIPASGDNDRGWIGSFDTEPFPDSDWIPGAARVGYDDLSSDQGRTLLGYWTFDDAQSPRVAADDSGRDHPGTLVGLAAFTPSGGGHTGKPGDRALDMGAGNNGASVRVDAAAAGGFDRIAALDQVTISLWTFGGPQLPAINSVFWFDSGGTTGDSRNIMVHLPWSDSVIYFDTAGCCAGDTRISRQETDATRWRGRWNHYVFLKDRSRKEIWQNGILWNSGSGAIPLNAIKSLWLGSAVGGSISYAGKLDDIAVWAGALSAAEIQSLTAGLSPLSVGSYRPLITTDLSSVMRGISPLARVRLPFQLPSESSPNILLLKLHYDDGFIAWLNGSEVSRRNVPVTQSRGKTEGLRPILMDLSFSTRMLRPGLNMLAIEGVNDSANGSDFLLGAELIGGTSLEGRYFMSPSPGEPNDAGVAAVTAEPHLNPGRGFYERPATITLSCATPGSRILYTLDGSSPTSTHGEAVEPVDSRTAPSASLVLTNTQVIRAFAMHDDYAPSDLQTHTFLFPDQIENQPSRIPGYPATWGVYGAYGPSQGQPVPADYAMDPRITRTTTAGYSIHDAILSLPALCISTAVSNLFDPVTGIYPNSAAQGSQWVRPASAELIFPDGTSGFQLEAGLRIHGGLSRQHWHARKHSFRLNFSREFGPPRLRYRLFEDTRNTSFNELTLRASSTDGWAVEDAEPWTRAKATYLRDPWMKDTQQAMGWPCGHSRYVHLFLNGVYWGQYNLAERTEGAWLSENHGGTPEDYDIVKDGGEVESGDRRMWDAMIALAAAGLATDSAYWRLQGRKPDGARDPSLPVYLDVDNLIDYMILHIYSGAIDWPNHNWWSARRRTEPSEGFRFFTWDQEISNLSLSATTTYTGEAFASVSGPTDSPAFLYARLRENARFRTRFAARAIALTTDFGILTPPQNMARWERRQAEIDRSIVAESARWGDSRQLLPLKRSDWLAEMNWMRATYWPGNHTIALGRFRSVGLYATSTAPSVVIAPAGGILAAGARIILSGGSGIYFTTNGSNPVMGGGEIVPGARLYTSPILVTGPTELRAQRAVGTNWTSPSTAFFLLLTHVAPPSALVVSEIHYHPESNAAEEFIELRNSSTKSHLVLGGARVSGGVDGVVPNGWLLAPGARVVLVQDVKTFQARYGVAGPVVGEFSGQLSNDGDWVHLIAPSGRALARFRYSDTKPWPTLPDGGGRSLTLVQSEATLDPALPKNWRSSVISGGTPGWADGVPFTGDPAADLDGDGLSALAEYFLGTSDQDPKAGPSRAPVLSLDSGGQLILSVRHPPAADQVEFSWEISHDLRQWEVAEGWPEATGEAFGNPEALRWNLGVSGGESRFFRLRLQLR